MASRSTSENGIVETIKTVVYALLIAGVFRTLFYQPFFIPSESMKDTLLIGDFLFVNKMAYGYSRYSCPLALCPISGRIKVPGLSHDPERGDIVVFRHPVSGEDYIKRLIGLPGDRVQMKGGILYINGAEVPQTPAGTFEEVMEPQGAQGNRPRCQNAPVGDGDICKRSRYIETLPNGVAHDVLNTVDAPGFPDTTDVYTVPEGTYFFMGDNRDNSTDSRFPQSAGGVGFVPAENLLGKASLVVFSSAGRSMLYFWTWRPDRFFHWAN
jgi:signal peptidase I